MYLAVKGRLATKDILAKWGVIQSPECPLCLMKNEDLDHLFFHCPCTAEVLRRVLTWQGINRSIMHWTTEVQWAGKYMKGRSSTSLVYKLAMTSSIYHLSLERNNRIFTQKKQQTSTIVRYIIQEEHGRGSRYPKLVNRLHAMNIYLKR